MRAEARDILSPDQVDEGAVNRRCRHVADAEDTDDAAGEHEDQPRESHVSLVK